MSAAVVVQELSTDQSLMMEKWKMGTFGHPIIVVISVFLLKICQYLSALSLTVRIMSNEPLLNVYTFQNK